MNNKKCIVLLFLGLFSIVCLFFILDLTKKKEAIETIQFTETVTTENLTLLERMYVDLDNNGNNESIELYTSAQRELDGLMGWDTGHRWLLLVRKDEKAFQLFDEWIQHGQLNFWVVKFNKSQKGAPDSADLESHIYVMKDSHGIELFYYYWDIQKICFIKEIAFNPPNQWESMSSMKYSVYDPTLFETNDVLDINDANDTD